MWGFDNSGDLSYETEQERRDLSMERGCTAPVSADLVVSADYSANRSTHLPWGSFAAGTRNRNFVPTDIRQNYTTARLEQSGRESLPAVLQRAERDLQRA